MIRRYDFKCEDCNHYFEEWADESVRSTTCTECGSQNTKRVISAVPTKFKGFGWGGQDFRWAKAHEKAAKKNQ